MLRERGQKQTRRLVLKEISNLLSKQSLTEKPMFLRDICGDNGLVMEDFHPVISLKQCHNRLLELP